MGTYACMHADAALFNLEYERWLVEHNKLVTRLRAAAEEHRPDVELRAYADEAASHYGALMALKGRLAAGDPLHLLSGLWKGAAERCLLWIGGFRPSEIIKVSFQTHARTRDKTSIVRPAGRLRSAMGIRSRKVLIPV
jgi:hypothetical protein